MSQSPQKPSFRQILDVCSKQASSDWEYSGPRGNLLSVEGSMIDAVLNAAIFAALALCIVGFSAWAHKRVQ